MRVRQAQADYPPEADTMTIPTILFVLALLLALIDEFRSKGQPLTGWAVVFVCIGLLWGTLR